MTSISLKTDEIEQSAENKNNHTSHSTDAIKRRVQVSRKFVL